MTDNLKQVLEKMFSYSPYKFSEKFTKKENWFLKYQWTQAEEDEFKEWLSEFLKKNWEGITERKPLDKRFRDKAAGEFVFTYGWTIKITN
jgi:hypothetical protein